MTAAFVVGIAGGSGSGKSTLVDLLLASACGPFLTHLPHDAYYLDRHDLPLYQSWRNWDHPDALDNELYLRHIHQLKAGQTIDRPVYDFNHHRRVAQVVSVAAQPIVLLEGILVLAIPAIREQLDLAVYIDTPDDLRIIRRMVRDVQERGRTVESVAEQYLTTVRPMHEQFVEPSRHFAHLWIPWTQRNRMAVDSLTQSLLATVYRSKHARNISP